MYGKPQRGKRMTSYARAQHALSLKIADLTNVDTFNVKINSDHNQVSLPYLHRRCITDCFSDTESFVVTLDCDLC